MEKTLLTASRVISWLFNPLFVPTYAMLMMIECSQYHVLPSSTKAGIVAVTLLISGILPLCALLALKSLKKIRDLDLYHRHQRTVPFVFTLACYVALALFLYRANAGWWLMTFVCGGILSLIAVMIINLRWKISAHLTAWGGFLFTALLMTMYGIATVHMLGVICAIVMAMGITATCRLILDCHTPMQLLCGALCGMLCTDISWIIVYLIYVFHQPVF